MAEKFNIFFPIDNTDTESSNLDGFKSILAKYGLVQAESISDAEKLNEQIGNPEFGVLKITISAEIVKPAE